MAFVVMGAQIVPSSLQFLDAEYCVNLLDTEIEEEEKEKEKELQQWSSSEDLEGILCSEAYSHHFEAMPPRPSLETHFPPPDFI